MTQRGERRGQYQHSQETSSIHNIFFDYLEPDAQAVHSNDSTTGFGNVRTDFGRINFRLSSNGSVIENIHQSVTDNEVLLRIRLIFGDALTLYAVRRFKIESHDTNSATRLTPMQPSSLRGEIAVDGFFVGKPRPVDFSCTELDLSSIPNGTRALLTAVPSGDFDTTSSAMLYHYPDERELLAAPPHNVSAFPPLCAVGVKLGAGSHAQCSDYYIKGLYRQHTNSSAFHDFSSQLGRARLINTNGFHVVCVSASSKDAGSVFNDGVMTLRFQKKDAKDGRC